MGGPPCCLTPEAATDGQYRLVAELGERPPRQGGVGGRWPLGEHPFKPFAKSKVANANGVLWV